MSGGPGAGGAAGDGPGGPGGAAGNGSGGSAESEPGAGPGADGPSGNAPSPPGPGPSRAPGPVPRNARTGDPGAQPERTRFAWRRTTLTFAVAVALAVRQVLHDGDGAVSPAATAAAAVAALSWVVFLVLAHRRIAAMRADRPAHARTGPMAAAVACTLAVTAAGVVLLW